MADEKILAFKLGDIVTDKDMIRVLGLGCSIGPLKLVKVEYTFQAPDDSQFKYTGKTDDHVDHGKDCEEID